MQFNDVSTDGFSGKRILIVGDVMVDRYLKGKVNRISPEAPVPVVHLLGEEDRLGGAANVALNVKSLGGDPILCSVIGDDEAGVTMLELLEQKAMVTKGLLRSGTRHTTIKSRVLAAGQQLIRIDREHVHELSELEESRFTDIISKLLEEQVDVILFQDYNKGVLTRGIIRWLIKYAKAHGILTVVDPKWDQFFDYSGSSLFKPNLKELSEAIGRQVLPVQSDLDKAVSELRERMECDMVMVTLSEHGIYFWQDDKSYIIPTQTKSVIDVSGAGDTVISVAALGIAANYEMRGVIELANKAAGVVCTKLGVEPIKKEELKENSRK